MHAVSYRFPDDVIALAVRWYLRFRLPDIAAFLAERGVYVDRSSMYNRVQRFTPCHSYVGRPRRFFALEDRRSYDRRRDTSNGPLGTRSAPSARPVVPPRTVRRPPYLTRLAAWDPPPAVRTRSSAVTTAGSNCVPAHRRNLASAHAAVRASWYGRSVVIAPYASHAAMTRAPSGIAPPASPSG